MKLDQLRYFVETAQLQHLHRAAKRLAISPSAVSHAISNLEEELGQVLFVKEGKNIALTEHGRHVLVQAQSLLSSVEQFLVFSSCHRTELVGTISLACTHYLSHVYLPGALGGLLTKHAKVQMEIKSLRSFEVVKSVLQAESDIGVCFSPQIHPKLDFYNLYSGQLRCVVREGHPVLSLPKNKQLQALSSYSSILPKAYSGIDICMEHPMLKKHRLDASSNILLIDNYTVAIETLQHTDAWSFLPDLIVARETSLTLVSHPKDWQANFEIALITRKSEGNSRLRDLCLSTLRDFFIKNRTRHARNGQ